MSFMRQPKCNIISALLLATLVSACNQGGEETSGQGESYSLSSPSTGFQAIDGFVTVQPQQSHHVDLSPYLSKVSSVKVDSVSSDEQDCPVPTIQGRGFDITASNETMCHYAYLASSEGERASATVSIFRTSAIQPSLPPISKAMSAKGAALDINIKALLGKDFPNGYQLSNSSSLILQGENKGRVSKKSDNIVTYTPPPLFGWNRIIYILDDKTGQSKVGSIYITISDEVNQPPHIRNPNLEYLGKVRTGELITIDLETAGCDIQSPDGQDYQLLAVQSPTAIVTPANRDSVTNTQFTFESPRAGEHLVSYIVADHYGGYSMGLIKVTVQATLKDQSWGSLTDNYRVYKAPERYVDSVYDVFNVSPHLDSGVQNSIAAFTTLSGQHYCSTVGLRLPTLKEMESLHQVESKLNQTEEWPKEVGYLIKDKLGAFTAYDLNANKVSNNPGPYYVTCVNLTREGLNQIISSGDLDAIKSADISHITDLSYLFAGQSVVKADISQWDVSHVTNMSYMFKDVLDIESDITGWDTSSVNNMRGMFYNAISFNQNITQKWDTLNVRDISFMFQGASAFNQNISSMFYNVSTDDAYIFGSGIKDENYLPDTRNVALYKNVVEERWGQIADNSMLEERVTSLAFLFRDKTLIPDVSGWDTSGITNMEGMFCNSASFNQDISSWDTDSVKNMRSMFYNATSFNQNLAEKLNEGMWNTTNVDDISFMFQGASEFNQNISSMFLGRPIDDAYMFGSGIRDEDYLPATPHAQLYRKVAELKEGLIGPDDLNNNEVTSLAFLFKKRSSLNGDIRGWDTSKITNMEGMFHGAKEFNQELKWDTSSVTSMRSMFYDAGKFNKSLVWDTSRVTSMRNMFERAVNFNGSLDFKTESVIDMAYMFHEAKEFNQELAWDVSNVIDMSYMFYVAKEFNQELKWDTSSVTSMRGMFYEAGKFNKSLVWDTSRVTSMGSMFETAVNFNGSLDFKTESVIDMSYMFHEAKEFNQELKWDTSSVTSMRGMFYDADKFNKALKWDTSSVTNMASMFEGAFDFNEALDFKTENVIDMKYMFYKAEYFNRPLDFNTQSVKYMKQMFYRAFEFDRNLKWDTSSVINMDRMFSYAFSFNGTLDFKTGNVADMSSMFYMAHRFNQDLSGWDVAKVRNRAGFSLYSRLEDKNHPNFLY